ncbi:MAG: hypothetical protein LUE23_01545 [Lachnospiraceae bacterium]|nr:hypothetical protein [Lachnospiraceae bacterium]
MMTGMEKRMSRTAQWIQAAEGSMEMNGAEKLISQYHTGYLVCLGLAMIFLVVTVFLFFLFHVPTLFAARSGRIRKRSIREIEAKNARSDRSSDRRVRMPGDKPPECLNDEESGKPDGAERRAEDKPPGLVGEREGEHTELLPQDAAGAGPEQTENKGEEKPCVKDETELWPGC